MEGIFLAQKTLPIKPNYYSISSLPNNTYALWSCVQTEETGISILNTDFMKIIHETWHNDRMLDMGLLKPFYQYDTKTYFSTAYQNAVYHIQSNSLEEAYQWDFGKDNIEPQQLLTYTKIKNASERNNKILKDLEEGILPYAMEKHNEWNQFIEKLNKISKGKVSCLFFLHLSQERELKIALKEENFNHLVFLDKSDEFNRLNKLPTHKFQTLLLNKGNRVIAIGNPISNPKIKELYLSLISGNHPNERIVDTKAEISTSLIDLGSFNWEQKQDTIFTLTNKGNMPLIIYKIIISCGCTTSHYDPRPIASGDSVNIQVSFKAEHPENFSKTILLHCNTVNSPFVLHIRGQALSHL